MKKFLLAGAALLGTAFLSSSPSYAMGLSFDCRAAFMRAKRINRPAALATARAHIAQRRTVTQFRSFVLLPGLT